jgi:hypothetical protein
LRTGAAGRYTRRRNKYGVSSVSERTDQDGYVYASKAEKHYADELELRKKAKDIRDWERQVSFPLAINGHKIGRYTVDFLIHHNSGIAEYVEVKGVWATATKLRFRVFLALYRDEIASRGEKVTVIMVKGSKREAKQYV